MTNDRKPRIDIGMEFIKDLYTGTNLETKDAQPFYILQRDTIRTFLHEKIGEFGISARLLGYLGVEVSIVIALATATFDDFYIFKAHHVQGTFCSFAFIFGFLILKDFKFWYSNKDNMTVDKLAENLGQRGTILKPSSKECND